MSPEQAVAYVNAMTACMLVEMEGMKAENAKREQGGWAPAYVEDDFAKLDIKYGVHHNGVLGIFEESA